MNMLSRADDVMQEEIKEIFKWRKKNQVFTKKKSRDEVFNMLMNDVSIDDLLLLKDLGS